MKWDKHKNAAGLKSFDSITNLSLKMPASDQFKPKKSYVPIIGKINPNSSHGGGGWMIIMVHHTIRAQPIVMPKPAIKYNALISM